MMLSIGVPVYNGAATLPRALDSLLAQDLHDFELVISDNGSTDDTPEIARRYALRDPRVRSLREGVNRGPTWNFNRVLDAASGSRYFMWAADDDRWAPDFASSCVSFLEAHPDTALCATRVAFTGTDGRETGETDPGCTSLDLPAVERGARYLRTLDRNSVFYGVHRLAHLGRCRLENRVANDQVFLLELSLAHPIHTLPEVRLWRQVGGTSASVPRIARVLGVPLKYRGPLSRIEIFESLFETIDRSVLLSPPERARLKREVLVGAGRRYLGRFRSPRFVAAKLAQDLRGW
jgi:glycosyltransferase involved in cell wall biosynthesis